MGRFCFPLSIEINSRGYLRMSTRVIFCFVLLFHNILEEYSYNEKEILTNSKC